LPCKTMGLRSVKAMIGAFQIEPASRAEDEKKPARGGPVKGVEWWIRRR
jgi:hypothetical protein